jgi:hypothetical protein
MSYCEQIVVTLSQPYVDLQASKVSQGRTGLSRLRIHPSMGRLRGPGGSGGCERLSQYFRRQIKLASTKAITARYDPGPASSIAINVQQSALNERGKGEMLLLYRVQCRLECVAKRFNPGVKDVRVA